jgi:quercetin dioxygenase-like cupin family protein
VYDSVAENIRLPEVHRGDTLVFLHQGAYCETESTQFNAFPRPEVVLLDHGRATTVKRPRSDPAGALVDMSAEERSPPARSKVNAPEGYTKVGWEQLDVFPQDALPSDHPWPERRLFEMRIYSVALGCQRLALSVGHFRPGESLERHTHVETEEVYFLMRGRAQVLVDDQVFEAKPLDAFRFSPETPRSIYNHTDEDCYWIFVGSPIDELLDWIADVQMRAVDPAQGAE